MKKIFTFAFYSFALMFVATSCFKEAITPSGRMETRTYDFTNFSEIDISSDIKVELVQSDVESITIDADDNMFQFLKVKQSGQRIKIYLDHFTTTWREAHITVYINYTDLNLLKLSGASYGKFYPNIHALGYINMDISGASKFEGDVLADEMNVSLSGASKFTGNFYTSYAKISLSGASDMKMGGTCRTLVLKCSGASETHCYDLICEDLDATISGASECRHTINNSLKVKLSGASTLYYDGNPSLLYSDISGSSKLRRR